MRDQLYTTDLGSVHVNNALTLLNEVEDNSIDLVMTSPPFALQREKAYGNQNQTEYIDWLMPFCAGVHRVLKPSGSFVLDLGGAYQRGLPVRSLYNYRVLIRLCDELGFHLAEEFFWYNPAKLPSPIEWVNKRKIRAKDAVNTVWWLSKNPFPKADVSKVLVPYSARMKKLQQNPIAYFDAKTRPSGHDIGYQFGKDNGGAIPSNLLEIANTESNSTYLRLCKRLNIDAHPARFPYKLPTFFINFLTEPNDVVLDIFAGSNTTGFAAEQSGRRWIAFEQVKQYAAASALRFVDPEVATSDLLTLYQHLLHTDIPLHLTALQPSLL